MPLFEDNAVQLNPQVQGTPGSVGGGLAWLGAKAYEAFNSDEIAAQAKQGALSVDAPTTPTTTGIPSTGHDIGQSMPQVQQAAAAANVKPVDSKDPSTWVRPKPPVAPGIVPPKASVDPVGHLAARNDNIAEGKGDPGGMITPAPDTTLTDTRQAIFKDLGQSVMETEDDLEPWYESGTFYRGLISFGLNLLSGNDLGASFNAAGNYYDQERGRELREMWRDDLLAKGYNEQEIQAYIESGDNGKLTDPLKKAQDLAQYKLGQLELQKARFEMDPKRLAELAAREDEEWKMKQEKHKMDLRQGEASIGASNALAFKRLGGSGSGAGSVDLGGLKADERKSLQQFGAAAGYLDSAERLRDEYFAEDTNIVNDSLAFNAAISMDPRLVAAARATNPKGLEYYTQYASGSSALERGLTGATAPEPEVRRATMSSIIRPGMDKASIDGLQHTEAQRMLSLKPRRSQSEDVALQAAYNGEAQLKRVGGRIFAILPDGTTYAVN